MIAVSLVLALCPCLTFAQPIEDDCCDSSGPSMSGLCCDENGSSRSTPPSATFLLASPDATSAPLVAWASALSFPAYLNHVIPTRPVVARAVLRI